MSLKNNLPKILFFLPFLFIFFFYYVILVAGFLAVKCGLKWPQITTRIHSRHGIIVFLQ